MSAFHPYFPEDLHLPEYVPPSRSIMQITGGFFAVAGVLAVAIFFAAMRVKHFSNVERAIFCW